MAIITFNGFSYDPDKQITKNFKVKDFLVTETKLPNHPTQSYYNNIVNILAPTMQNLYDEIGPFKIISAFRTPEIQEKITGKKGTTLSFHEVGLAVDIYPTTQSIDTYFGKILASPKWMNKLYEIFLKPPQNTIHLSVSIDNRKGLVKIMNDEKTNYITATAEQIKKYINDATSAIVNIATTSPTRTLAILGGTLMAFIFFVLPSGKKK